MKSFIVYTFFLITSFVIVSCGEDNTTTPNNPPGETLIYSRDTFNLSTSQQGNFYAFNNFTTAWDTSQHTLTSIRLTFEIAHNLDSTSSRGLIAWNPTANPTDSISMENLRGNHSIITNIGLDGSQYAVTFYNVIYFSNLNIEKYIKVSNIKVYKAN